MERCEPGQPTAAPTFFAPAERSGPKALRSARAAFQSNPIAVTLLEAIPDPAVVLNSDRQIIAVNHHFLDISHLDDPDFLLGMRPGEAMRCFYADEGPGGCGTGRHCAYCGAVQAIMASLDTQMPATRECRLLTRKDIGNGLLELEVEATFLTVSGEDLLVVTMRDISADAMARASTRRPVRSRSMERRFKSFARWS